MHSYSFWHVPVYRRLLSAVLLFILGWGIAGCGRPDVPVSAAAQPLQVQATTTLTGPELDATNQAIRDLVRHAQETEVALPRTPDLNAIPPTPATTPSGRVQTGIFTFCSDPTEVLNLEITNCWFDAVNGEYVWVDAGARLDDPNVGRIEVVTYTLRLSNGSSRKFYETPQANGAVTILSVTGERVLLAYPDGNTIIFNVTTRLWKDAVSTPVPTTGGYPGPATPTPVPPTPGSSTRLRTVTLENTSLTDASTGFVSTSGTVQRSTSSPINGTASLRVPNVSTGYGTITTGPQDAIFVTAYVRLASIPGSARIVRIVNDTNGSSVTAGNLALSSGKLRLRNGSTTIGTMSATLTAGTLYRVGIGQQRGSGSGILEAYLAEGNAPFGTPFASSNTQNLDTPVRRVEVGATNNVTLDATFDDIAVDTAAFAAP